MSADLTRGLVLALILLGGLGITLAVVVWCVRRIAASLAALELADYQARRHVAATPLPRDTGEGRGGGPTTGEPR